MVTKKIRALVVLGLMATTAVVATGAACGPDCPCCDGAAVPG